MSFKKNLLLIFIFTILHNFVFCQDAETKKIIWTTDWNSNEKYIALGGNLDSLKIYSTKDFKLIKSYPIAGTITCLKWHPSEDILAIGTQSSSETVRIFDLKTNKVTELAGISPDGARGIDWNYTGDILAVADNDGQISIFDKNGQLIRTIKQENTKSITGIDWHPKKNIFVTVGDKIRVFNLEGALLKTINHREQPALLLCVSWHNSGDFFVTGDYGDNEKNLKPLLQYWTKDGKLIRSNSVSLGEYRNLTWNSKGNRLASASDALRIWNKKGKLLYEGISKDYLWGIAWSKANRIVTTSSQQGVIIWSKKAKKILTIE